METCFDGFEAYVKFLHAPLLFCTIESPLFETFGTACDAASLEHAMNRKTNKKLNHLMP